MKNSLALVISEQEREYIRKIYSTKILTEQDVDQPEDIEDFQDWMDENHPNWVNGKNLNQGGGYGTFGPKTNKAWSSYKDEYLESKNDTDDTPAAPVDDTKYYYSDSGKTSSVQTKEQIDELIANGTITPDTLIYTNKTKMWSKASTYDNLDVVPAPPAPTTAKTDTTAVKQTSSSPSSEKFTGSTISKNQPISAFEGGTPNTTDGLKSWYKNVYKKDLPDSADIREIPEKRVIVVVDNGKSLTFSYNDKLQTFNLPRETTKKETKIVTKPVVTTTTTSAPVTTDTTTEAPTQ